MPKRRHESTVQYLASKLKKLEKKFKRSRKQRSLSESSSSSSSSRRLSSSESSREFSPAPPVLLALSDQNRNERYPATTEPAATATAPDPIAGTSTNTAEGPPQGPHNLDTPQGDGEQPMKTDTGLDPEIFDILGTDPSTVVEYGPDINDELASRLNHVATSGLDKEVRKELLQKYLIPGNCKNLSAPQLNPEIKAATPEYVQKRDKSIEFNQKQIAAAVTCIGQIVTTQINNSTRDSDLLKKLMDVSRILCDLQFVQSTGNCAYILLRNYALASLKKDLKEQLSNTKIDDLLFGQNLTETLKAAKAVSRSSSDLKADAARKPKQGRNLNAKTGPGNHRAAPGPQRQQPPPAQRATTSYQLPPLPPQHQPSSRGHYSNASSYRPRQTRRR